MAIAMKVYFGGCERPNALRTLARGGAKRIMLLFAEPPSETCWSVTDPTPKGGGLPWRGQGRLCD